MRNEKPVQTNEEIHSNCPNLGLEPAVQKEVDEALRVRPKGLESVREIFEHFGLGGKGVTRRRFKIYARHTGWGERLKATGEVAQMIVEPIAKKKESVKGRANSAVLLLISRVVEALGDSQATTEDLVRLSKVLAEQRRILLNERVVNLKAKRCVVSADSNSEEKTAGRPLSERFPDVIRGIYGVAINPQTKEAETKPAASGGEKEADSGQRAAKRMRNSE